MTYREIRNRLSPLGSLANRARQRKTYYAEGIDDATTSLARRIARLHPLSQRLVLWLLGYREHP